MHSRSNSNVSWSRHSLRYSSENVHTIAATATATGTGTTPASRIYTTPNATHLANSSPSLPPSFTASPQVAQSPRSPSLLPPPFYSSVRSKLGENSRRSSLTSIGSLSTPTVTTLHTTTTTTTTTSSNKSESDTLVRPQRFYLKSNAHNTTVHSPLTLTRSQQQQQQQQKYKLQRTVSHSSSSSRHDEPYTGTVTVAIRIKPNVTTSNQRGSHHQQQHSQAWHRTSSNTIAHDELGSFTFDHVFDHTAQNTDIYTTIAVPLLQSLFTGYNATLFAYGMTGSGKTYTMMGDNMGLAPDGLVPLSVSYMFATIAKLRSDSEELRRYDVFVSYLEIYNEKVYDLLDTGSFSSRSTRTLSRSSSINSQMSSYTQTKTKAQAQVAQLPVLNVRDDPKSGVKVIGLTEQRCESQEEVLSWIESGDSNRKRGQTDYNTRSSRSHAIIMLKLVTTDLADGSQASSTLSLCDLAGSERYTGQAERRKEGAFINKSLLTLGTVISKLSAMANSANNHTVNVKPTLKSPMRVTSGGSSGTTTNSSGIRVSSSSASASSSSSPSISHIPYRDSKLTRILQPALSGNSIVATICTVDPSEEMVADTLNTLRFGSRAKNISLRAMKRSVLGTTEDERNLQLIRNLRAQIDEQNKIIEELKRGQAAASVMEPIDAYFVSNGSSSGSSDSNTRESLDERVQSSQDPNINLLQAENTLLKQKLRHCENLLDRDTIELQDPEVVEIVEMLPFEVGSMLEVKFQNIESQLRQYKNYTHELEGRLMSLDQAGQPIKRDDVDRDQCMNQVNGLHVSDEDYQSRLDAKDRQIEELEKLLQRKDKMIEAFQSLRSLQERVLRPLDSNKVSQMMT